MLTLVVFNGVKETQGQGYVTMNIHPLKQEQHSRSSSPPSIMSILNNYDNENPQSSCQVLHVFQGITHVQKNGQHLDTLLLKQILFWNASVRIDR